MLRPYQSNPSGNSLLQEEKKSKGYVKGIAIVLLILSGGFFFWDNGEEENPADEPEVKSEEIKPQESAGTDNVVVDENIATHDLVIDKAEKDVQPSLEASAKADELVELVSEAQQNAATAKDENGPRVIVGQIDVSLYNSFASHFDKKDKKQQLYAQQLAAHFKRLFFFEVNFKRDLRPNDLYAFVWELTDDSTDGIRIVAAKYYSNRHKRLFEAYYYKDSKEKYGRHYDSNGQEVQRRLKTTPIKDYEQVTSLLHDRRPRHNGIDFKAPVGTPLYIPFDAKVLTLSRKIRRGNGRFLKVQYLESGLHALFLHMDSIDPGIKSGKVIKAGTPIGTVGNTGRSYSAHLHYQVQKPNGRILNPYKVHGYTHRKMSESSMPDFKHYVRDMELQMSKFDEEMDKKIAMAK